jgi:carboxylesterase type B
MILSQVPTLGDTLKSCALQGVDADGLSIYKGVPYAAPPVGESRWRELHASGVQAARK